MTNGISPKVKLPAWALILIGVVLLVIWFILGQNDDTLLNTGIAVLGAAGVAVPIGFAAKPGDVTEVRGPASDDRLSPAAVSALHADPVVAEIRSSETEPLNPEV